MTLSFLLERIKFRIFRMEWGEMSRRVPDGRHGSDRSPRWDTHGSDPMNELEFFTGKD